VQAGQDSVFFARLRRVALPVPQGQPTSELRVQWLRAVLRARQVRSLSLLVEGWRRVGCLRHPVRQGWVSRERWLRVVSRERLAGQDWE
jgi:hypothetical protein